MEFVKIKQLVTFINLNDAFSKNVFVDHRFYGIIHKPIDFCGNYLEKIIVKSLCVSASLNILSNFIHIQIYQMP